jgi:hypothetical protein
MALWGKTDAVGDAPKFPINTANGYTSNSAYANTSGNPELYAVDVAEAQAARGDGKGSVSPGWVTVTKVGSRKRYETLVALKVTGGDNTANATLDDATFPDA